MSPSKNLFSFLLFSLLIVLVTSREVVIYNRCPFTTWVGIVGSGNLEGGGFKMDRGDRKVMSVDEHWSGRIWPRTECDGEMNCATGGCGPNEQCNGQFGEPPMTIADISLNGDGGQDSYSVSLELGYNIPVFIDAYEGIGTCVRAGGCFTNPNDFCPMELAVQRAGMTVGCKTGCLVYNTSRECCTGSFASTKMCEKTLSASLFKKSCPAAISHPMDDANNTVTCSGASYVVQFC